MKSKLRLTDILPNMAQKRIKDRKNIYGRTVIKI